MSYLLIFFFFILHCYKGLPQLALFQQRKEDFSAKNRRVAHSLWSFSTSGPFAEIMESRALGLQRSSVCRTYMSFRPLTWSFNAGTAPRLCAVSPVSQPHLLDHEPGCFSWRESSLGNKQGFAASSYFKALPKEDICAWRSTSVTSQLFLQDTRQKIFSHWVGPY